MDSAKMDAPTQRLGTNLHHYMAVSYATMRQPVLTRQYMALAEFPGVHTSPSLFFGHEFWFREDPLRLYFDRFNLAWSTEHVQVVLAPLFGVHACFHLQMLHDYEMPASGGDLVRESTSWATHCSLDNPNETHCFKIDKSDPVRIRSVKDALKAWCKHDAQFYLGDGVFTVAPTNVFLAMNGVSPDARFTNEHEYCKMVIKQRVREVGLPPSAMWMEFWTAHPELKLYLDEASLTKNIQGDVILVHVPHVWAEPIPGVTSCFVIDLPLKYGNNHILPPCPVSLRFNVLCKRTCMGGVPSIHQEGA
jgi:hypothetical protein